MKILNKLIFVLLMVLAFNNYANTQLEVYQKKIDLSVVYPGASQVKPMKGMPALRVLLSGKQVGYVIVNTDYNETIGYSGKPIHLAIGIDNDGEIKGVQLLKHSEPIILTGIPEKRLTDTFIRYEGFNIVTTWLKEQFSDRKIDAVSGATVTDRIIDDSVLYASLKFATRINIANLGDKLVNKNSNQLKAGLIAKNKSWHQLIEEGSIVNNHLTVADVSAKYKKNGDIVAAEVVESDNPTDTFIDLNLALVSVEEIGKNILGKLEYRNLTKKLSSDQHAFLVMAKGLFSFRGSGFVRGGIFDRFTIKQESNIYRFRDLQYKRLSKSYAEKSPRFDEIGLFIIPKNTKFDPTKAWYFNLLINRVTSVDDKKFYNHAIKYQLPKYYFEKNKQQVNNDTGRNNLIIDRWQEKKIDVIILLIALAALTVIFFVQNKVTTSEKRTNMIRNIFLVFTVLWIGFWESAQLSIVNVLTFINVLMDKFNWSYFLLEPMTFILWGSVAVILVLWGRGVYCGWLCPFGALQELLNKTAQFLKVPQVKVPWWLHERLWAIKYLLFLGLLAVSLYSLEWAEHLSEAEPFKTSIILKFSRTWPFVVYALVLLIIGLFIERFYCRYICSLGAALAIPAKLRIFNWLKRYPKDCGTPCQTCAHECMVDAIHPEGNINDNECMQCLHCQVVYKDEHKCPVVVKNIKREARYKEQREKKHLAKLAIDG